MSNSNSTFDTSGGPSTFDGSPQVGFIGLGHIGYFMARNLAVSMPKILDDIPPLLVWNRSEHKAKDLVQQVGHDKACIAKSPEDLAASCDVIFVNLATDDVVRSMYQRLMAMMKKSPPTQHKVFVETSTIYPSLAADLDSEISSFPHCCLITCPVIGTPAVADKADLLIIMSGEYRAKKWVSNLLVPGAGRKIIDLGEDLQKALTFKLTANMFILGNLEVLAETFTFAEKSGIGAELVSDFISEYFPVPSIMNYAHRMLVHDFDSHNGFALDGGIKDATHMRRLAIKYNSPMPVIDNACQHLLSARALHTRLQKEGVSSWDGEIDWSSLVAGTRIAAGLDGLDRTKDPNIPSTASTYEFGKS